MGIRKFNNEGPSATQFGDILYNFTWMLILKIIAYLILKQFYRFFLKILRRHKTDNVEASTNVETCDKAKSSEPQPTQGESNNLERKKNDTKPDMYNRKNLEILLQKFKDRLDKEKLN